eukprot:scaffold34631_cov251-Amphora_coffeaeformis.AAC.9
MIQKHVSEHLVEPSYSKNCSHHTGNRPPYCFFGVFRMKARQSRKTPYSTTGTAYLQNKLDGNAFVPVIKCMESENPLVQTFDACRSSASSNGNSITCRSILFFVFGRGVVESGTALT